MNKLNRRHCYLCMMWGYSLTLFLLATPLTTVYVEDYDSDPFTTLCANFTDTNVCQTNYSHRNCFCDQLCWVYDDCCVDAPAQHLSTVHLGPTQRLPSVILPIEVVHCGTLHRYANVGLEGTYLVVAGCPNTYTNHHTKELCESESEELFLNLPVTGNLTQVLYRNIYCAMCNAEPDIIYWTAERDVCNTSVVNALRKQQELNPLLADDTVHGDCLVRFSPPVDMSPRSCKVVVRKCSVNWTEEEGSEVSGECREYGVTRYVYEEPVLDEDYGVPLEPWVTYRNVHCARCNHVNIQKLRCYTPPLYTRTLLRSALRPSKIVPFSVVLDINRQQQILKDNRLGSFEKLTFLESCPEGHVYDPFSAICRVIYCTAEFVLTADGCVPILDKSIHNDSKRLGHFYDNQNNLSYLMLLNQMYNVTRNVTVFFETFAYSDEIQGMMSFVFVIVSLVCLVVQFIIYMMFSELRNLPGKCVIALIVSLFIGLIMYTLVSPSSHWFTSSCFYTAVTMHYTLLAAFFWMNVLAVDICSTFTAKTVRSSSSSFTSKRFVCYSVYAWLVPTIIVGISVTIDLTQPPQQKDDDEHNSTAPTNWGNIHIWAPRYEQPLCWINQSSALLMWFILPLSVVLLTNLVLFTVSVYSIRRATQASQPAAVKSSYLNHLFIFAKLLVVMGLTWLVGLTATFTNWEVLWYIFIIFNSLQGAFIALAFICTKKVFRLVRARLPQLKSRKKKKGQSGYSRSYSGSSTNYTKQTSVL